FESTYVTFDEKTGKDIQHKKIDKNASQLKDAIRPTIEPRMTTFKEQEISAIRETIPDKDKRRKLINEIKKHFNKNIKMDCTYVDYLFDYTIPSRTIQLDDD